MHGSISDATHLPNGSISDTANLPNIIWPARHARIWSISAKQACTQLTPAGQWIIMPPQFITPKSGEIEDEGYFGQFICPRWVWNSRSCYIWDKFWTLKIAIFRDGGSTYSFFNYLYVWYFVTVTTYVQILFMTTYVYNRLCFCGNFIFVIIYKTFYDNFYLMCSNLYLICVATYVYETLYFCANLCI